MNKVKTIIILFLMGLASMSIAQDTNYEDVSVKEFKQLIEKQQNGLIIDLRTPKEYNAGHIKESVNIDYFAENFEAEIAKLDKSKTLYIYCASGGRSGLTMKLLKEKGFKSVYHLPVGYDGWQEATK